MLKNEDINNRCFELFKKKTANLEYLNISIKNYDIKSEIQPQNLDDEELNLNKNEFKNKSFEFDLNEIEKYDNENEENSVKLFDMLANFFSSFEIKGKYLKENSKKKLYNFMIEYQYQQDLFFDKIINKDDNILSSLINYIKSDLNLFCKNNQLNFIKILYNNNRNKLKNNNYIFAFNENVKSIYFEKIKNKFNDLKNDNLFAEIKYITILVAGKSRIGKSTLINAILRENLAKTDEAQICTMDPAIYFNDIVPYYNMVDTRGIELIEKFGIEKIFEKIKEICINPNKAKSFFSRFKSPLYKDDIQCIWYCVNENGSLEDKELELIKTLIKEKEDLPLIFVYTIGINVDRIEEIEKKLKEKFPDIPFHPVLAFDKDGVESYGLEDLIYKTLIQCKDAFNSKFFNGIKNDIKNDVINHFKEENELLIAQINEKIAYYFINNYNNVLDNNQFKEYIYDLIQMMIFEFLQVEEKGQFQ